VQIIFCSVPYRSTLPGADNSWFSTEKREISAYVANRTGVLSFANLALAILFATRNNPLLWATGVSQTTSLIFHRWAARVSTVQAIVHSIIYTYTYFWDGGYSAYAAEAAKAYYWWGIIATLALFLGIALSILPLRLHFYETFVVVHIVVAILSLIGCWYHIYLRFALKWGYEVWLYLAMAFWAWDRIVRFGRLVYFNWVGVSTTATAELLTGDELIKLNIVPGRSWSYSAGQHTFLSFPSLGYRPWESHPFSIAGWGSSATAPVAFGARSPRGSTSENEKKTVEITSTPISNLLPTENMKSITFLIRAEKGVTKSLQQYLLSKPRGPQPIQVWTEGPHGYTVKLDNFGHVLLIGGGIGVTALLPYAQVFALKKSEKQTMTLAYTAREPELITLVKQILHSDVKGLEVNVRVTETESERMDIGAVLRKEAAKGGGNSRLAVVVCGPPELADEVRREAVKVVGDGMGVALFEENFCW